MKEIIEKQNKQTKIIVCYHKNFEMYANEVLLPLHVGKSCSNVTIPNTLNDNSGDNISFKNQTFCELTGLYWLWKNVDADNYGLFHYRRFLNIVNKNESTTLSTELKIDEWSQKNLDEIMDEYDIILPDKVQMGISLYDQYKKEHYVKDLETIIDIIKRDYPQYIPAIENLFSQTKGCMYNMFIMKKDLFQEYCTWLFDILFKAENEIDISNYNNYQKRVFGFLSERMFNIFIEYKKLTNPNLKIKYTPVINVDEVLQSINLGFFKYINSKDKYFFSILGIKISKKKGEK